MQFIPPDSPRVSMQADLKTLTSNPATGDVATPLRPLLLGLVGSGIQRSLTPALHESEGRHHGLRVHYQLIDLDGHDAGVSALPTLMRAAQIMGFAGLNITYPCKQAVIPLLDELSDEARAMGAVNTVVFSNGRVIGHNTDSTGWVWGLRHALPNADLSCVVLLGSGGAGSAIAHAALGLGVAELRIVDREPDKALALMAELRSRFGATRVTAFDDMAAALRGATGLVHATPTGMAKLPGLPLPQSLLRPDLWVSEIVYFPQQTALLKAAVAIGCKISDGTGMAVGQALGAFKLFTGFEPEASRMRDHMQALLAQRSD